MDIKPLTIKENFVGGIVNQSKLLKNGVRRCAVIGGSGSGKSYWLTRYWIKMIHKPIGGILVVAKNQEQDTYKAIENYCEKEDIPYKLQGEFTMEDFEELRGDDTPKLIIYDDLASQDNIMALLGVAKYGRVKHQYLVVVSQDYKSINKEIRQNINNYAIFPLGAPHASRSMINGLGAFVNEENLKKAYQWICRPKNKHSMILIQLDGPSIIMNKDGDIWDLSTFKSMKVGEINNKSSKDSESEDEDSQE